MSDVPLRDRGRRRTTTPRAGVLPDGVGAAGSPRRSISDCGGDENLPGGLVRAEGQPEVGDPAVNEAYQGLGETYALYWERFRRDSIDGEGLPLDASVHYGQKYDNAFWDGQRMVFGDGDGEVFTRFTISMTVIGHELTHGVTQFSANLTYQGQSGALNESVSDVFGSLVEQHANGQSTSEASWLIGEGLFTDQVQGTALRSMKAPGTAYDDDVLGKDPQPADMSGYVDTADDNGGVHLNSGIPNRAFFLVADALGGFAWEAPGQIWYDTLTGGALAVDVDFAGFARATLASAARRFGEGSREHSATGEAWTTVGVDVA
jgi:Zn-dependent metalloprotease